MCTHIVYTVGWKWKVMNWRKTQGMVTVMSISQYLISYQILLIWNEIEKKKVS